MDIEKLSEKLENAKILGNLPKILIPVHLGGSSCDMQKLKDFQRSMDF